MKRPVGACALIAFAVAALTPAWAQEAYKLPPQSVVEILDAPPTPIVLVSPSRDAMLLVNYQPYPPIEMLARPFAKLGGLRVDPQRGSLQRLQIYTEIQIQDLGAAAGRGAPAPGAPAAAAAAARRVELPAQARIGLPVWSYDGARFAFTRDLEDGVEIWVADARTGKAHAMAALRANDVLGSPPFSWTGDNRHLLVRAVSESRGSAPVAPRVPAGPDVEQTSGKFSKVATYQDLLKNPHDADLFEYYAASRLILVDVESGSARPIGAPGLFLQVDLSPDEKYLLVTRLHRPLSYRVPCYDFARTTEVWDANGARLRTIADLPVSDEVPPQGVPTGPRSVEWQPLDPAALVWAEALDGGDPMRKVPFRDKILSLSTPFGGEPREVLQMKQRFRGLEWTARKNVALLAEYDRDRRWETTYLVDLAVAGGHPRTLFDLSANDSYNDPGDPVHDTRADGRTTILQDGDWIYLAGRGASETGDRPFLDRMNLGSLKKERLFRCGESSYEQFLSFVKNSRTLVLARYETRTEPPNFFLADLRSARRTRLTDFKDPAPQLTGMTKKLLKYRRADGVPLSGMLYLPPGWEPGTRLPLVLWAYPLEYSDASTAGQVRGSPNSFTRLMGASQLFFVTQGYAVLNDATMPVIGDPEHMNDTFVEQIVGAAKAAIDTLDAMGVIDRRRVAVGGHSYGAFMTANLLAHSDLFAAGIARSGAYNRSLTPFGFQSERRSYWEATDVYTKISPFTYADHIRTPILLIHGEEDNNSGTHTIQSERLFQAIRGNGGTARLVLLPYESHGYRARESLLTVLAEMFEWADKYVKNRPEAAPRSD